MARHTLRDLSNAFPTMGSSHALHRDEGEWQGKKGKVENSKNPKIQEKARDKGKMECTYGTTL